MIPRATAYVVLYLRPNKTGRFEIVDLCIPSESSPTCMVGDRTVCINRFDGENFAGAQRAAVEWLRRSTLGPVLDGLPSWRRYDAEYA